MNPIESLKNLLFRCRHGFRGAPVAVLDRAMRLDESLRRWQVAGEAEFLSAMRRALRPNEDAIDIGANFGLHAWWAAQAVAPHGRVLAFEPLPSNLALLRRHVRLNGMEERIIVCPSAVSDSGEPHLTLHFADGHDLTASLRPDQATRRTLQVSNHRLDEYPLPPNFVPRLIKIDVEGAELSVLRSAQRLLARFRPQLFIEVHGDALPGFGDSVASLEQFLADAGYASFGRQTIDPARPGYFHLFCRHRNDSPPAASP